jgi:large subunit ribosomal protein L17
MRHQQKIKKFSRKTGERKSFMKGLARNLIIKGEITTTETRAKAVKSEVEKFVTLAKKQNLASLRLLIARVSKEPAHKLYYEVAPKYAERKGGYIRITKISAPRLGDATKMARVEFV